MMEQQQGQQVRSYLSRSPSLSSNLVPPDACRRFTLPLRPATAKSPRPSRILDTSLSERRPPTVLSHNLTTVMYNAPGCILKVLSFPLATMFPFGHGSLARLEVSQKHYLLIDHVFYRIALVCPALGMISIPTPRSGRSYTHRGRRLPDIDPRELVSARPTIAVHPKPHCRGQHC